jgi:ATP-dependent protease ClpP protease subunit
MSRHQAGFFISMRADVGKRHRGNGTAYICFFSAIEAASTQKLLDVIANNLPEDTHTIYIMITTQGGSIPHGFFLYNILRGLPYKIVMHNIGSVDSIGNVMFFAAEERYSSSNGTFLIHKAKTVAKNDCADEQYIREKLSCLNVEEKKIRDIFETHTKIPSTDLDLFFQSGELKDANYALETGMIKEIREIQIPADGFLTIIQSQASDDD